MGSRSMLHTQGIGRSSQDSSSLACGRRVQREVSFRCCAISNPALKESDRRITCTQATASSAKFAIDCAAALYSNNMTGFPEVGQSGVHACIERALHVVLQGCKSRRQRLARNHSASACDLSGGMSSEDTNICTHINDCATSGQSDAMLEVAIFLLYLAIQKGDIWLAHICNADAIALECFAWQ